MKVRIFKSINHSLFIDEADLLHIFRFLKNKYTKIQINAYCIDGSRLESDNIEEILKFNNPRYRKIKNIEIEASDTYEERVSLELGDNVQFTIHSHNDETARDRSQELLKMLSDMKPYYDLIARASVGSFLIILWGIAGLLSEAVQFFGFLRKSTSALSALDALSYSVVFVFIIFLVTYPIDRLRSWMFPKMFFNIGNQKREMTRIKKWREIIFVTILLGIIVSLIVFFITKPFL